MPGSVVAHYSLGIAEFHLERYPQSIQDYTQAIRYNPKYALAYAGRAIANTILGADDQQTPISNGRLNWGEKAANCSGKR